MKTAVTTLPVDTVRLYGKLNLRTLQGNPKFRFWHLLNDGITARYRYTLDNGYEIKLDYRYGTAFLQFEFGDLVYGHNYQLLTLEQAQTAIQQLCHETGLNLESFQVGRLDITKDTNAPYSSLKFLKLPKYFKERKLYDNGDLLLMTKRKAKNGQADRSVSIYQKGEKVRIEMRLINTDTIKRTFLLDKPLKLADVLTDQFVQIANNYHADMTEQMTNGSKHPQVMAFKVAALQ